MPSNPPRVAVLIPCLNEESTVAKVVNDFRTALPAAAIYVYDNNSTDATAERAQRAGAIVRLEAQRGKGHVVRRMFADIDADIYLLVDGDDTYDASASPRLVREVQEQGVDLVNASRGTPQKAAYRPGHKLGNRVLTWLVTTLFDRQFGDMLSGYKAFSRRFVKSFPVLTDGFDIETEIAVHALEMKMRVVELETPYWERPEGSVSKLRTFRDGTRILGTIVRLVKEERPLQFFSAAAVVLVVAALVLAAPIFKEFIETGLVPRLPTAVLATGMVLAACLSFVAGLILDTVTRGRREAKRMQYLAIPGPRAAQGAEVSAGNSVE